MGHTRSPMHDGKINLFISHLYYTMQTVEHACIRAHAIIRHTCMHFEQTFCSEQTCVAFELTFTMASNQFDKVRCDKCGNFVCRFCRKDSTTCSRWNCGEKVYINIAYYGPHCVTCLTAVCEHCHNSLDGHEAQCRTVRIYIIVYIYMFYFLI